MIRFLEARAGWFVLAIWILFPVGAFFALALSVGVGISLHYFPQSSDAALFRFVINAVYVVIALGLVAVLASSIFLMSKRRLAACVVVVAYISLYLLATVSLWALDVLR